MSNFYISRDAIQKCQDYGRPLLTHSATDPYKSHLMQGFSGALVDGYFKYYVLPHYKYSGAEIAEPPEDIGVLHFGSLKRQHAQNDENYCAMYQPDVIAFTLHCDTNLSELSQYQDFSFKLVCE